MPRLDLAALLVPGRLLTESDCVALLAAAEEPWEARQRALQARAAAIRAALAATGETSPTAACCRLGNALRRRAARGPVDPPDLAAFADAVLRANEGRPLGWRQLLRIEAGSSVIKTAGDDNDSSRIESACQLGVPHSTS